MHNAFALYNRKGNILPFSFPVYVVVDSGTDDRLLKNNITRRVLRVEREFPPLSIPSMEYTGPRTALPGRERLLSPTAALKRARER